MGSSCKSVSQDNLECYNRRVGELISMSREFFFVLIVSLALGACVPVATATPVPDSPGTISSPTSTKPPEADPTALMSQEATVASCPPIDGDVLNQIRSIEEHVSQLRGLQAVRAVERTLFTPEQLRTQVVEEFLADYTVQDAEADEALYFLLGLLPNDLDLHQLYTELLSEQVAGFYDTEADEMVVVCAGGFNGVERLTYAHEYVHTLQDQLYGFENGLDYSNAACKDASQRCAATRALFEGDAALLQEQWLRRFASDEDINDLQLFFSSFSMPVYDSAPAFIQAEFTFPYLEGLFFVRSLYLKGGWAAVDEAYLNPPQSTEQILHPERYPRDAAIFLKAPDLSLLSASGWEIAAEGVLGEWVLLEMFDAYLSTDEAKAAAGGWGGDVVVLLNNPSLDEQAFILLIQWDSMRDAHEFTTAFKEYGALRFGDADLSTSTSTQWNSGELVGLLERHSNQTLIIVAATPESMLTLRSEVSLPAQALP